MEQEEGIMSEFDKNAFNINGVDFYNTVYVGSDLASDHSYLDSDADYHTPLRLYRHLSINSSDAYFSDDV